jgi:hypothetical protein
MQTFVPYDDFEAIASCLDYRRLGKQRVECMQILNALTTGTGWIHHPATRMWADFPAALRRYQAVIIREWINRGYHNTMAIPRSGGRIRMPDWWGGPIHTPCRSVIQRPGVLRSISLVRKAKARLFLAEVRRKSMTSAMYIDNIAFLVTIDPETENVTTRVHQLPEDPFAVGMVLVDVAPHNQQVAAEIMKEIDNE